MSDAMTTSGSSATTDAQALDGAATAASMHLASCHMCMKLVDADLHQCPRCGSTVHLREPDSVQRTLVLLVTATLLYIPANLLPIMYTDSLGRETPSTIMGGVVILIELGSWPIAAVIFLASVCIPSGKLMMMYYLCWCATRDEPASEQQRTIMYRATEIIGRWSMIDVFVVSILVGLVHLGNLLVFRPGAAAIAFGGVVIVTMIAAEGFDARLLWDRAGEEKR